MELLGRKQLGPGSELPLTPADPASRILEALLDIADQAERMEVLPAALQPPDPHSAPMNIADQAERMEMLPAALQPPDPHSAPSEACCSPILARMHAALSTVADLPALPVQGIDHAHE